MKEIIFWLFFITLLFCFGENTCAQSWKKVVPLVSTCEQLKEILPVKDCNASYSKVETPEYEGIVFYSTKTCQEGGEWNVPTGTVTDFSFTLKPFMRLTAYGSLKGYLMKPEDDLPDYETYTNDEIGISLSIMLDEKYGKLIQDISLYPSAKNKGKSKCGAKDGEKISCPNKKP